MRRDSKHKWLVIMDVAKAVDQYISGHVYEAQRRRLDPATNQVTAYPRIASWEPFMWTPCTAGVGREEVEERDYIWVQDSE